MLDHLVGMPYAPHLIGLPGDPLQGVSSGSGLPLALRLTAAGLSYYGDYFLVISEVEFYASADLSGTKLAGAASVSSVRAGYPERGVACLTDGVLDTTGTNSWNSESAPATPQWMQFNLNTPAECRSLRLFFPSFDGLYFPSIFQFNKIYSSSVSSSVTLPVANVTNAWQNFTNL